MALFTSKVDYALRALLDLTSCAPGRPAQSREIAARQDIPESYLNQLLVVLRRAGLVRSVRGAAGGYILGKEPRLITVDDVIRALHGPGLLGDLPVHTGQHPTAWAIRNLNSRLNRALQAELVGVTLGDLALEVQSLDDTQSLMLGL
jgi:Rrf2 family protein